MFVLICSAFGKLYLQFASKSRHLESSEWGLGHDGVVRVNPGEQNVGGGLA